MDDDWGYADGYDDPADCLGEPEPVWDDDGSLLGWMCPNCPMTWEPGFFLLKEGEKAPEK